MENKVNLSSPWVIYFRKISALFEKDPAVKVLFDDQNYVIKIYVEGDEKAKALEQILPSEKTFGNIVVKTIVIPANQLNVSRFSLFQKAFESNPIVSFMEIVPTQTNNLNFIVFKKKIVQFFNDNVGDYYGVCSTLYQDIAKDIFGEEKGIYFCTDVKE